MFIYSVSKKLLWITIFCVIITINVWILYNDYYNPIIVRNENIWGVTFVVFHLLTSIVVARLNYTLNERWYHERKYDGLFGFFFFQMLGGALGRSLYESIERIIYFIVLLIISLILFRKKGTLDVFILLVSTMSSYTVILLFPILHVSSLLLHYLCGGLLYGLFFSGFYFGFLPLIRRYTDPFEY